MRKRLWHLLANVLFRLGNRLRDLADACWDREGAPPTPPGKPGEGRA
jgi:hypothetical protein